VTYLHYFQAFPNHLHLGIQCPPLKLSILIFSLVSSCILLSFYVFLIVLHFPFRFSQFLCCRLHIFMYIHSSIVSYNKISSPLHLIPHSHSGPLAFSFPFDSHTLAQHPNLLNTPLLLRTRLTTFAHSYTCDHHCFVCFGHSQRCASASLLESILMDIGVQQWMLLDISGYCWLLLVVVGYCQTVLDNGIR